MAAPLATKWKEQSRGVEGSYWDVRRPFLGGSPSRNRSILNSLRASEKGQKVGWNRNV